VDAWNARNLDDFIGLLLMTSSGMTLPCRRLLPAEGQP
jgi:hypothetical protein